MVLSSRVITYTDVTRALLGWFTGKEDLLVAGLSMITSSTLEGFSRYGGIPEV